MTGHRILVVDDDHLNRSMVANLLESQDFQVKTVDSAREALYFVEKEAVDIILLDVMMPEMDGFEACMRLRQLPSTANTPIILLTALDNVEQKIRGFDAGADDYIAKPFEPPELLARIQALIRRSERAVPEARTRDGKCIACFSLRGGVGTTTLATNLAVGLAQIWRERVVLVDLSLPVGQSTLMLNLALRQSWGDLASIPPEDIDIDMLEMVLRSHETGVRVLASPNMPEEADTISGELVARVLALLKRRYEYIVLDLSHQFSSTTLAGLDAADSIVTVLTPELASVHATSLCLETFDRLEYDPEALLLILNWTFAKGGLPRSEIEAALKRPMDLVMPFAPEPIIRAINTGVPLTQSDPESPLGMVFEDLAYWLSKEDHRNVQPEHPSTAWDRVARRARSRKAGA